ncbi:class I SAM-dependent methyltransferase [Spartinivicinus poritis]|uniref:Class I SAM-dependent methyltransferase n=1 Tax=Spartinivicinus poritis TaxID=2994640 RepID=A0ABT5UDD7_9GAMM|nr:class I SAM-dependent methyltransferase [Spartinivicinus sp. A2-2]MDE1463094.1 class I SAM-dependent methyltransferase [Spartinivicinus sp. A2-2]
MTDRNKLAAGFTLEKDYDYYNAWESAEATYNTQEGTLQICGHPVMERWQTEYMRELAKVAASNGGRVLELGFGLGLSSSFIQEFGVTEHVIVEPNIEVFKQLMAFSHHAKSKVIPIMGKWQEVIDLFAPGSFDAILFDASPLSEVELHRRQFMFLECAGKLLKREGVFTYCNVTSWGNLMAEYQDAGELFEKTQMPELNKLGFNNVTYEIIKVVPGEGCKYRYDTLPVPSVKYI